MSANTVKDATRQLQTYFSTAKAPLSLPPECRRILQAFIDEHDGPFNEDASNRVDEELKVFWRKYVRDYPKRYGTFIGVLKELGPALTGPQQVSEWYTAAVKPVLGETAYGKVGIDDSIEFLVEALTPEDRYAEDDGTLKLSKQIRTDLMRSYTSSSGSVTGTVGSLMADDAQIAHRFENVLIALGRKRPKDLFQSISEVIAPAESRLPALSLLSSFLRSEAPRTYSAIETPLFDQLITCLMNDTSVTVLSIALTSLTMLMPHIPVSMVPHLPRLFLIYSRLLCWERFNPHSTDAQKNAVTDNRVDLEDIATPGVGTNPSWSIAVPREGESDDTLPDVSNYFTLLYGMYPLSFMSYIRKPRRYLKDSKFPGAEDFDLNRAVIRSRSGRFRQTHLLHPNFYNLTIDEELNDPKWLKLDPADVVADCHGYRLDARVPTVFPEPPVLANLLDLPLPSGGAALTNKTSLSGRISPVPSHSSLHSLASVRDTPASVLAAPSVGTNSPMVRPLSSTNIEKPSPDSIRPQSKASGISSRAVPNFDDLSQATTIVASRAAGKDMNVPHSNLAYLQREVTLLQNDLNFERWHKSQYSQHISQMMRENVREATAEAETLNLINQNHSLKAQLDQARKAREATIKDSVLTRKQANNLEVHLLERFNKMKAEQEVWIADAEDLRRLREEITEYRELLVASEAREVAKSYELQILRRDVEQTETLQAQLRDAKSKLREYEYGDLQKGGAEAESKPEEEQLETPENVVELQSSTDS